MVILIISSKNLQGDIIKLIDSNGDCVVKYAYDAWGKVVKVTDGDGLTISDNDSTHIANINPFRYRGYYYDVETKLYYLQSRYYDPEICRFINADVAELLLLKNKLNDCNLYAYCNNNSTNSYDINGYMSVDSLAQYLAPGGIFLAYLSGLLSNIVATLAKIALYIGKLLTPIATKAFWWKPWMIAVVVIGAIAIITAIILVLYYSYVAKSKTITIGNVKYKCDTKAEEISSTMAASGHQYYPAVLFNNAVWVQPVPISATVAQSILRLNSSTTGVFALNSKLARGICGGYYGPEVHGYAGYWPHYHPVAYPSAHSWFLLP